jgi:hypothetical protein
VRADPSTGSVHRSADACPDYRWITGNFRAHVPELRVIEHATAVSSLHEAATETTLARAEEPSCDPPGQGHEAHGGWRRSIRRRTSATSKSSGDLRMIGGSLFSG